MRREGVTVFSRDLSYFWYEVLAHLAYASPSENGGLKCKIQVTRTGYQIIKIIYRVAGPAYGSRETPNLGLKSGDVIRLWHRNTPVS